MRIASFVLIAGFGLAACDSPSPAFRSTPAVALSSGGYDFHVHRRGDRVEVYRTGMAFLPARAEVLAASARAIQRATGCRVRPGSLTGDQAIQTARLDC